MVCWEKGLPTGGEAMPERHHLQPLRSRQRERERAGPAKRLGTHGAMHVQESIGSRSSAIHNDYRTNAEVQAVDGEGNI